MSAPFSPVSLIISLFWAVSICGIAWYCARVAAEITYVTLADGRRQERALPLFFRLLLPWTPNFTPHFGKVRYAKARETIDQRIVASGFEGLLTAQEFMALRLLMPLVFTPIFCLLMYYVFSKIPGRLGAGMMARLYIFILMTALLFYAHPMSWLRSVLKKRHRSIERSLPFVLDLLTLSVEAGLDFMSSIQRIIERSKIDALGEELIRVFREVQLGKTRKESLKDMAERVGQGDLRSVSQALIQADELGVSIGTILRIQADQMRIRRFQRAEKLANEAPVKLLFPLITCIFPCVFIVLLGPVIMEFLKQGF